MPAAKTRNPHDDFRHDFPTGKEKLAALTQNGSGPKAGRKPANGAMSNGSSLKEVVSTSDVAAMDGFGHAKAANGAGNGLAWGDEDRALLHEYRFAYRLDTPASFKSPMSPIILGSSGVGKQSPTMARRKNQRRVQKDQLATAVRKNFNALPVNENDVIVSLMYKTRNHDKTFRVKFAPNRKS